MSNNHVFLGTDARGNITRLDNALDNFPERIEKAENHLGTLIQQRDAAQAELGKPFPLEEELAAKSARLAELDALLNMEDSPSQEAPGEERTEAKEEGRKPSVLAELKAVVPDRTPRPKTHEKEGGCPMTNEELNTALYKKMFAEQEQFKDWLLTQPPEKILDRSHEYSVREDFLLALEYDDLTRGPGRCPAGLSPAAG